jgi:hypothetical protein
MAIACSEVAAGALASGACAVPAGHLPLGSACTDGVQCASLICDKSAAAAPDASKFCGACSAGCGSACAAPNVCVQAAGVWKCIDLLPEGAPCSASTLSCTEGTQCMGGTCKRRGGEGADCTQTLDCDYTRALDCFEQKCTRLTLAEPGAVCGDRSTCAQGYHCVGGTTTHPDSTCIPPVADGATCNALTVACRPPAACYGQVCTLPADAVCR